MRMASGCQLGAEAHPGKSVRTEGYLENCCRGVCMAGGQQQCR
eukprot:CAMPEP_0181469116 /NCGR_PEP_ID=MMETSP1110-20121109/37844_1 /TAXON_ID=174948 /ORGANISM="Symbiodinium sp., Strain CCMP421" /LENGTH=42 /DNA_ID= /DNA_START= /DNA_END= /DNA_ORIENTATION=